MAKKKNMMEKPTFAFFNPPEEVDMFEEIDARPEEVDMPEEIDTRPEEVDTRPEES